MLQKLRVKFIVLTMAVLFLVLATIMGAIQVMNYRSVMNTADRTLEILMAGGGRFPEQQPWLEKPGRRMSPELPFETRFFSVQLDRDGNVLLVDMEKIAAISSETAAQYGRRALQSRRERGLMGSYRYAAEENRLGTLVVFLDCGRQLGAARSFWLISTGISLAGFGIVSILLYFFSARIVRPIAQTYEKQRQFITNASHDLKTPITIIRADADVLELEQGTSEWLLDIRKQTNRLTELIQELVFLCRMEEQENRFQLLDFPISDVVSEEAQSFEALAVTQGKTFALRVEPMLSYCGDEKSIRQLVTLLLDNAIQYSNEGGNIWLSLERGPRTLVLTVYNTCACMEQVTINRLFDRFYRGDPSRNSQTGGYGIGLSVAQAVVQGHKGTIRATSADGHSLAVTAVFPVK